MRTRRSAKAGFTMIEVMMAVVVFLTAAVGLVAFEQALIRSNSSANDLTAATYIADFWLERARTESLLWNTGATDLTLTRTPMLSAIQTGVGTANFNTGWVTIPGSGGVGTRPTGAPVNRYLEFWNGTSSMADYAEFCVQYRLITLMPLELLRVEVRVLWFKKSVDIDRSTAGSTQWVCPASGMLTAGGDPDVRNVDTVQFATSLWRNQVIQ